MEKKGISQEGLKLIACVTMLLDHIGAALVPQLWLRVVGRLAFPIYCFLMAEGVAHTRNPKRYLMRLGLGALLAEVPFDLLFFGRLTLQHQSVMITLLLGCLALLLIRPNGNILFKILGVIMLAAAADLLGTDYGGYGVLLIVMFGLTREMPCKRLVQFLLTLLICWLLGGGRMLLGGYAVPIQVFGALAILPIALYSGRKATNSKAVQIGFYLFYPVHLAALLLTVCI